MLPWLDSVEGPRAVAWGARLQCQVFPGAVSLLLLAVFLAPLAQASGGAERCESGLTPFLKGARWAVPRS